MPINTWDVSYFSFFRNNILFTASTDELIVHALIALRDTLPAEENLLPEVRVTSYNYDLIFQNTSICVVGKGTPFKLLKPEEIQVCINTISATPRTTAAQPQAGEQRMQQTAQNSITFIRYYCFL